MNAARDFHHLLEPGECDLPEGARVPVPWARVELDVRWPRTLDAHVLLAAVGTELQRQLGTLYHADWLGRDPDTGECIHRRPVVRYDLSSGAPVLWMDGDLAHDHAAAAARYLHALTLPAGEHLNVLGVRVDHGVHVVGVQKRKLYRYHLATPFFPSESIRGRKPHERWAIRAWAATAMRSSLLNLLASWGVTWDTRWPPLVQVESGQSATVTWRRPREGREVRVPGFTAELVSTVSLPPGAALGANVREGWGRLDLLASTELR